MQHEIVRLRQHSLIPCFTERSVVDLGANKGKFSRAIINAYPFGKLIMVEGNPTLVSQLQGAFPQKNVTVHSAVVSDKSQNSVRFYVSNASVASSLDESFSGIWWYRILGFRKIKGVVDVPMIALGDLFQLDAIERIDLLKMDIEGSEWDILGSFGKEDYTRIDQISVEFHDFIDKTRRGATNDCIQRLLDLGYSVHTNRKKSHYDVLFYKGHLRSSADSKKMI